jgi:hypothetical protein
VVKKTYKSAGMASEAHAFVVDDEEDHINYDQEGEDLEGSSDSGSSSVSVVNVPVVNAKVTTAKNRKKVAPKSATKKKTQAVVKKNGKVAEKSPRKRSARLNKKK